MAANGRTFPVGTVFAHVFRYFRDKAIEECKLFSKTDLTQDDVKWVITVPAMLSDVGRQMMREAAYEVSASKSKSITLINYFSSYSLGRSCFRQRPNCFGTGICIALLRITPVS